jgi:hypothetical protein
MFKNIGFIKYSILKTYINHDEELIIKIFLTFLYYIYQTLLNIGFIFELRFN